MKVQRRRHSRILKVCPGCNGRFFGKAGQVYCTARCQQRMAKRRQQSEKLEAVHMRPVGFYMVG